MSVFELDPIPIVESDLDANSYHAIPIDYADPRNKEPLVDISQAGVATVPYYFLSDGSNPPYKRQIEGSLPRAYCRASLIPMLKSANNQLAEHACELVVYDAYRPVAVQQGLWVWALAKVRDDYPMLSEAEVETLTSRYSADPRRFDPTDSGTWPPHSTGAAIDVVLRSKETGDILDMGAGFDEPSVISHTDHLEREWRAGRLPLDCPALGNRRLLYWAMTKAGFANYPAEYWHFDFGNQMYVLNARKARHAVDRAWYGYCQ